MLLLRPPRANLGWAVQLDVLLNCALDRLVIGAELNKNASSQADPPAFARARVWSQPRPNYLHPLATRQLTNARATPRIAGGVNTTPSPNFAYLAHHDPRLAALGEHDLPS
jgi:hypothetical protein